MVSSTDGSTPELSKTCLQKFQTDFFDRFKQDDIYRNKVLFTFVVYIAYAIMGGVENTGPTFLDLRSITNVDLNTGSWLVTCLSLGHLFGTLLCGVIYDRTNPVAMMSVYLIGITVAQAAIPWCSIFEIMATAHFVLGMCSGLADCGGTTAVFQTWSNVDGAVIVGIDLFYSLGGAFASIFVSPFLTKIRPTCNLTGTLNISDQNTSTTLLINTDTVQGNNTEVLCKTSESKLYLAYSISAFICFLTAGAFFLLYLHPQKDKNVHDDDKNESLNGECLSSERGKNQLSRSLKIASLLVMALLLATHGAVDEGFEVFLPTFCVEELRWTKQAASFLASVVCIAATFGGLCGILLTRFINEVTYEGLQCIAVVLALAFFFVSVNIGWSAGIWITVSIFGFAGSVIMPLTMSWTARSIMPISSKLSSLFIVAATTGTSTNPLLIGYLMETFSNLWFCYAVFIESIVLLVLFCIALVLTKYIKKSRHSLPKETLLEVKEHITSQVEL